ncbi:MULTISPECIES: EamA family transporter RarD [Gordonibacter]|uniref:EamA family transporter RarD n=1 Tax=Gordonibacter faecis TaxID=3047475 RepID=A0ABT7DKS9_9ACTN|nr:MULTISPECIES: EamA family transporter RarD [unclassified Gordonibacter]MDJ1650139.1 EamA family transporter RarD [Gordonibacter sp. KGMB12511]HIW75583.1 EamA family transporter RarD [Candidatus Gordonibacter avicola]
MSTNELQQTETATDRTGFLQGLGCYLLWGVMPVYWKLLSAVPALEVLAWRMVWSCVAVVALCVVVKRTRFLYLFRDRRAVRTFLASGLIVTCNWGVYVWAANSGHLLETSIGYYLCPLCNIALGLLVFKERLTPMQKLATVLAAVGVGHFMVVHGGDIWIAFALALTFSVYGAVKKKGGYPALPGMAFESLLTGMLGIAALAVGAVAPWIWQLTPATPDAIAVLSPAGDFALLIGCGILTAIPLLLYSAAANRISMTVLGFIQYVSPTIALVLAVAFFGEQFTVAHGVCFALIWAGIAAVGVEALLTSKRTRAAGETIPAAAATTEK